MDAIQATFAFFESLLKNRSPPKHFSDFYSIVFSFSLRASYYSLLIKYCENRWNRWFDLNFVEEHVKINIFSKTNHNEDNSMRKKFVFFKLLHIFFQYFKFNSINYHIIERGLPLFSIKIIIQWIKNWIEFVSKCLIIPLFRLFFFFFSFLWPAVLPICRLRAAPLWILETIRAFSLFSVLLFPLFLFFSSSSPGMNSLVTVAERGKREKEKKENYKIVKPRVGREVKGAISIFHISFNYIPEALIFTE